MIGILEPSSSKTALEMVKAVNATSIELDLTQWDSGLCAITHFR